jgi:hypothetical protein
MSGNQDSTEPRDGHDRLPRDREPGGRGADAGPDDGERIGHAHPPRDDDEEAYEGVRHRTNRMPAREDLEDDEDELAEADMMEVRDLDDLDDLEQMDGPDA